LPLPVRTPIQMAKTNEASKTRISIKPKVMLGQSLVEVRHSS
jgi:hypothetical protein